MESTNELTYIKALAKLNSWDKKLKYYNFYSLHDLELYGSFERLDVDLEMYLKPEALKNTDIKFKSFANARDGGEFAIWFDESMGSEPPVVYFDSDFGLFLVTTSMEAFLCKIAKGKTLTPSSGDSWSEIYEWEYEDLAEEHEEISAEEMKSLVTKEIEKFTESVKKSYKCEEDEQLFSSLKERLKLLALYGD